MKKILLASTALVMTAGVASAADITIGGDGYFGVGYGAYDGDGIFDTTDTGADERTIVTGTEIDPDTGEEVETTETVNVSNYSFLYDLDIDFTVSGTTDSGLVWGASGDFDDLGASQGARGWDNSIFVSGDFGTLSMGDISGGAEEVVGDLAGVGMSGLGDLNEFVYLVAPDAQPAGPVATYTYNISGLTLALGLNDDAGYSVGVGYATDLFSVGLAYEDVREGANVVLLDPSSTFIRASNSNNNQISTSVEEDTNQIIGQASVNFAGATLKGIYGRVDQDNVGSVDQYGVSGTYAFNAFSVSAYWRQLDSDPDNGESRTVDLYGLGAGYDLGGGLSLQAGVAQYDVSELEGLDGNTVVADFGVAIDF